MATMKQTDPPSHFTAEAKKMWAMLRTDYDLDDAAGLALLRAACEAFQRCEQARAAIAKDGAVVHDRFGQDKASPWCNIERDARAAMVSALRALRLSPGDTQ